MKMRMWLLLRMTEEKGFIVVMRYLEESRLNWTMMGAGGKRRRDGEVRLSCLSALA